MKRLLKTLILLLSLVALQPLYAQGIKLSYIALSGQSMPGTRDQFRHFLAPYINDGHIAFIAKGADGNLGIYSTLYGPLAAVATNHSPIPGGTSHFTSFTNFTDFVKSPETNSTSITGATIAFIGTSHFWESGLYRNTRGQLFLAINQNSRIPAGTGNFIGFAYPTALRNGTLAFWGKGNDDQEGLYTVTPNGVVSKLVDTNTNIPGGAGSFQHILYPAFSHNPKDPNSYAFVGTGSNGQVGIYLAQGDKLTLIANTDTKIPGKTVGYFTDFLALSYDAASQSIAFIGKGILGQLGIYQYQNGTISKVVDLSNFIPSGFGQFRNFESPNIENGAIVFKATGTNGQQGLYLHKADGQLVKLISTHDKIDNKEIRNIGLSNNALDDNQIAFAAELGRKSSGVFLLSL